MQIIFNGKTYNSLEDMPANERQAYEHMLTIFKDANDNGIPDFMEGDMAKNVMTAFTSNVNFNGKVYSNLNELPPEAKEKVQKAFDKLKQMGIVTDTPSLQGPSPAPADFDPAFQSSKPMLTQEPVAPESGGRNWILIVGFLAAILVCALAIALVIYAMR